MVRTHRPLTVTALLLAMFMSAMEATVVGTAMPTIVSHLHGIELYGWVGAAYMLASTVSMPVFGKLADVYGRKPFMFFGVGLFLVGSFASGLSTSIAMLVVARAAQGLGAGAMQPVSLTMVGDLFTIEERGKVQGFFGAVWGLAGVAGPLLGGAIISLLSWRWVFWINIPFGVASMLVLAFAYREEPRVTRVVRIDWMGALLVAAAPLAFLLAAQGVAPLWTACLGAGLCLLFVVVERAAKEPVLPLALLSRRSIAVACVSNALLGAATTGAVMFVPLFVQGTRGASVADAGSTIAPMLIGWPIAATATSRMLVRTGFRTPVWIGSVLCVVGIAVATFFLMTGASLWSVRAAMFVYGLGMGLTMTALLIAVQFAVEQVERGVATAVSLFARSMGSALGVGALGALLAARLGATLAPDTVSALLDPARRAQAAASVGHNAAVALGAALDPIFLIVALLAIVNLLAVALYPRGSDNTARATPPPSAATEPG